MGSKYPILKPGEIIPALSKKGLYLKAKKEATQNIRTVIGLLLFRCITLLPEEH
jgi:hypothetical protein